jgi:hypothetical protein
MVELHNWLSHQHSGLRTYVALQKMTDELAETDAEHRAVYRLLSSILDPFIASFDEEPCPQAPPRPPSRDYWPSCATPTTRSPSPRTSRSKR